MNDKFEIAEAGVFGELNSEYLSDSPSYEENILRCELVGVGGEVLCKKMSPKISRHNPFEKGLPYALTPS